MIVFSTLGERPDFTKMSCGDLDGDTYLVIWDKELVDLVPKSMIIDPAPI